MLCALALALSLAAPAIGEQAQQEESAVVALVNGEALTQEEYAPTEISYLTDYASLGYDITDEAIRAYVQDLALTGAIENMLVRQDMRAQGFYDLDEETERWAVEQGNLAYEQALGEVGESLRQALGADAEQDMTEYALGYAQILGVTAEDYIDVYRTQVATVLYYDWLTQDWPVTQEDVQAAFEAQATPGEAEMTEAVYDALAYEIYTQRCAQRLAERIDELADGADVVVY